MINVIDKTKCCGCGSCANICPRFCITMKADKEGFLYPNVNEEQCVKCDLCEKACPELGYEIVNISIKSMIIQCSDLISRLKSTAGGGFVPIANYVLKNGGIVFGAAYMEDFSVQHIAVDTPKKLYKLQGSKYVQSKIGSNFDKVKTNLDDDRMVLFSGTPCQVAGLYKFLKSKICVGGYDKLFTISVACRAVPSPLIFNKYIELQQSRFRGNIESICCRDKYYGYSYSTMSVYAKDKSKHRDYHRSIEADEWLRCFFSGICDRPCCGSCDFTEAIGDFHIGDYFKVGEYAPEMDDNLGATRMIIGSQKGIQLFKQLQGEFKYMEVASEKLKRTVKNSLYEFGDQSRQRGNFFSDAQTMSGTELFAKYFPRTMKVRILQYGRFLTYKLGVYRTIKKMLLKLKK